MASRENDGIRHHFRRRLERRLSVAAKINENGVAFPNNPSLSPTFISDRKE
jgi:hypothetical protein